MPDGSGLHTGRPGLRPVAPGRRAHVLEVSDLRVRIGDGASAVRPVDGVSFSIGPGETLGLVGESGCGKSLTCLAVAGLLGKSARRDHGRIVLQGRDLADDGSDRLNDIGMIFQNPLPAMNPVRTVGWQLAEVCRRRAGASARQARGMVLDLLERVGIPEPARRAGEYPHQLSGGMNQRIMIAMALAGTPKLLIADEPTTALDVTVQAQILDLLRQLQREFGMAILFVTHDLGLVGEIADNVAIMYAGRVVERLAADDLFDAARHPYTRGLLACLPSVDEDVPRLKPIEGAVPTLDRIPAGCAFAERCGHAIRECRQGRPALAASGAGFVACHRPMLPWEARSAASDAAAVPSDLEWHRRAL